MRFRINKKVVFGIQPFWPRVARTGSRAEFAGGANSATANRTAFSSCAAFNLPLLRRVCNNSESPHGRRRKPPHRTTSIQGPHTLAGYSGAGRVGAVRGSLRARQTDSSCLFSYSGGISLVTLIAGSPGVEVGMVGREGLLGGHLVLGVVTAPLPALAQGSGAAWRSATVPFMHELARSAALQRSLNRYLYVCAWPSRPHLPPACVFT